MNCSIQEKITWIIATVALAGAMPAALALDVVACTSIGAGVLTIGSDPRACQPDRRIDATAASSGFSRAGLDVNIQPSDFQIAKRLDRSSTALFIDAMRGKPYAEVLVVFFDASNRIFSILLEDAFITSLTQGGEASKTKGALPTEAVSLKYQRITIRDDLSGALQCWDFARRGEGRC